MPPRPFDPPTRSALPAVIGVIALGVMAGAAGMLFVLPYATSMLADKNLAAQPTIGALRSRTTDPAWSTLLPASRASVLFAVPKAGADTLSQSYVAGDAFAMGIVVTSDGWLAAVEPADAVAKKRRLADAVALIGGKSYRVSKTVRDSFSGVTFLKIEAENLPVTAFGESGALAAGDTVFSVDPSGSLRRNEVLANELLPATAVADAVRSSELAQRMLRVERDADDTPLAGTILLNVRGEIVGLMTGAQTFGAAAVPIESFSKVVGSILRNQPVARPFLGVHYIDLALLAGRGATMPQRGALLAASADGRTAAVTRGSPAAAVGLRAGDVIVAVDGEQVSGKNPLAEALSGYEPGDSVILTVQRGAAASTLEVTATLAVAPVK